MPAFSLLAGSLGRTLGKGPAFVQTARRLVHIDASSERELFSATTIRWLYNEEQQRRIRYVPFNVQAFIDVAVRAANATSCTSLRKIRDGMFNRTFLLRFDNDVELIAKIPFPVTGPKHYSTASEVATLDYLRSEHGIPVPIVRAWCSKAETTPVGVEYIMYEKLTGVALSDHDKNDLSVDSVEEDSYVDILPIIQRIECRFATTYFSQIGSLYYREDVPEALRNRPLYVNKNPSANSARFCIGPTVNREFWRGGRAALDIDRGPWNDVHSYMYALGACARASVKLGADPKIHDEYRRLISDYDKLVPYLAKDRYPLIFWHPDLNAGNIIVSETTKPCKFVGIIDWQGATIAPYYDQMQEPPAYVAKPHPLVGSYEDGTPGLDPRVDTLSEKAKKKALHAYRRSWRQHLHKICMQEADERIAEELFEIHGAQARRAMASPSCAITHGTDKDGLLLIRHAFVVVRTLWEYIVGADDRGVPLKPFPLEMSDQEQEQIQAKIDKNQSFERTFERLLSEIGAQPDGEGIVSAAKYDAAKEALDSWRQRVLSRADDEETRALIEKVWPLRDGVFSPSAETCH